MLRSLFPHCLTSCYLHPVQAIAYYLLLPLLYLVSLLPFPVIYVLSDIVRFFVFYVAGYRKKVVMENLRNSFPEKTEREIHELVIAYYRHLCDLLLEAVKGLTMSQKELVSRCPFSSKSLETFDRFFPEKRSTIMLMGHLGNWDWACQSISYHTAYLFRVIFHPLSNPYFNRTIIKIRSRYGAELVPMASIARAIMKAPSAPACTAFVADQSPPPKTALWLPFLNQDTPFYNSAERFAHKLNFPVIYLQVRKVKRGYYEMDVDLLFTNPATTDDGIITSAFVRRLEQDIRRSPVTWLWSHRRWKHRRNLPEKA